MQVDLKRLKPLGIVLILAGSLMALILCFTGDLKIPEPYEPRHEAAYYSSSREGLEELMAELEAEEFPRVEGEESCLPDWEALTLTVSTDGRYVKQLQAILDRDFGQGLITVKEN